MAVLASNSNGNFTTAATWSAVDSGTFTTALATQETGTTNTAVAFTSGVAFTPGGLTLDGILLKISSRSAAPTGTFSVRLAQGGTAVTNSTVTVNVSDIPNGIGWMFFKFSANVTLAALTAYTVQLSSSTANQVQPFRKSATASDWTFGLRTTTTQAPASADQLLVVSEWDSAGVNHSITVTLDNTAATTFGPATAGIAGLEVSSNAVFQSGTSASTNYLFNLAGSIYINNAATITFGTGSTPLPSTSSLQVQLVCTSNVEFGIESRAGSTFKTGGAVITNSALLAADAAISATSLTTSVSTGWKSGDNIAIAATTRTRTEAENKTLSANASGTTLTIAALSNAHSGTSPTQAELINLTRNVKIFGSSTTNQAYLNFNATSVVDIQSTEIYQMGSATSLKRGIDVSTTTGSFVINNSSIHDFAVTSSIAINLNGGGSNNFTISNNIVYNIALQGIGLIATTGTNYTVSGNIVMAFGQQAASQGFSFPDLGGTLTNNTATSGQGAGFSLTDTTTPNFGTISGLISHSNSTTGVAITGITGLSNNPVGTISNVTVWRNNTTAGLQLSNSFTFIIDTVTAFGNNTANISIGGTECDNIILRNMTIDAGTTLVCPVGLNIATDTHEMYIDNSTFGGTTTHSTGDINVSTANIFPRLVTRNTSLNSSTPVASPSNMTEGSFIGLAKLNTTAGNHKMFKKYGTLTPDTTIFNRASPSTRLTPNSTTNKLQTQLKRTAVPNGQTAVLNVWVRKSVVGDGSAYNGTAPRLILKADPAAGINSDTILATSVASAGTWELLSGTTAAISDNAVFSWYVDCDGSAGWVNIDDYSANS